MLGTYIFLAITVAAVLFMIRFLIAICGVEGEDSPVAYAARFAPERNGPSGSEHRNQEYASGEYERRTYPCRVVPIRAGHEGRRPANAWKDFVALHRTR